MAKMATRPLPPKQRVNQREIIIHARVFLERDGDESGLLLAGPEGHRSGREGEDREGEK